MENKGRIIVLILLVVTTVCVCIGAYVYNDYLLEQDNLRNKLEKSEQEELENIKKLELEEKLKNDKQREAEDEVNRLFLEDVPVKGITDETLDEVVLKIGEVEDETVRTGLLQRLEVVQEFRNIEKGIHALLVNGVLISNYKDDEVTALKKAYDKAPDSFTEPFMDDVLNIDRQRKNIDKAKKNVKNLFSDAKMTKVKSTVTRAQYNTAKKSLTSLPQKDIVKEYTPYLEKALKVVEENEEKARKEKEERERREREIAAAWVKLETPYISQNRSQIFNGCEAASLLMGLQYKGYLKGLPLKAFVDAMPKSDNPHEGFVEDPYNFEPRDVPHWIAPDALAKYGRSSSGNGGISDITGASVDYLKKELDKGNPVVVYITGGQFDDLKENVGEVPLNVHVVLLIGYNPVSKQMVVNDPWTKSSDGKVYVSEGRFTYIYNAVGKKAVVIR